MPRQKENELTQQNTPDKRLTRALTEDPDTAALMALMKLKKKQWPLGSAAFVRAQFRKAADLAAASLDEGYLCATAFCLRAHVASVTIEKSIRRAATRKGARR
jgi:aminoglycoside phosphotransferase family enzyme